MSSTPLMSEYPVEKKEPIVDAVPAYESDVELVVGAPAKRCFWARLRGDRCARACGEKKQRSPIRRAIRWFLTIFILLGVSGLFLAKRQIRHHIKSHPVVCVPIAEASTSIELHLANKHTQIGIHPSLAGGDARIVHSEEVKEGSVLISFDLPQDLQLTDAEGDAELFVCHVTGPKYTGLGVHRKGHGGHGKAHGKEEHEQPRHIKALSTTITLPASEAGHPRSISFHGARGKHGHGRKFGNGCMRKRIKMAIAKAVRAAKAEKWVKVEAEASE